MNYKKKIKKLLNKANNRQLKLLLDFIEQFLKQNC